MSDNTSQPGSNSQPATPLSLSDRVRSLRLPDRPAARSGGAGWVPWALCVVLLGSTGYFAARSFIPAEDSTAKKAAPDPRAPGSASRPSSAPAPGGDAPIALEAKGYIIPVSLIQVSPKVGGMVTKLYITEGMQVQKGDTLATLEDVDYRADRDRARGASEAAEARWQELWKYRDKEISQVRAELDDAKTQRDQLFYDWKRNISLKNSNAVANRDFEQAESSYKSMDFRVQRLELTHELLQEGKGPRDQRIAAAQAELDQARADLAKAEWRLTNTIVKAPISGIILSKKAEEGNQVNPSAFSNGLSASLCEMADLTNMEVDLAIAERDISKVFKGQKCQVKAEAYADRLYQGEVSRVMPTADRAKGAVPVRVKVAIPREEEGKYLRPEMGAVVTFLAARK